MLPRRIDRMVQVLANRTRHLTIAFEDLYHPHNAGAVMRTAECFGIQDIHIVENLKHFRPSKGVVQGSARWLTLHRYRDVKEAWRTLKDRGYRLAATSVDPGSLPLEDLPVDQPLALCFGTEELGLTEAAFAEADLHVHVPMVGFTESLNVSVTAALCIRELTQRIRQRDDWQLSQSEIDDLRLTWLMQEGNKARALTIAQLREWNLVG